jgi:plastocyanin
VCGTSSWNRFDAQWKEHHMRKSWRRSLVIGITILVMAMAAAGSVQASNPNTVTAVNKFSVDINDSFNLELRFAPATLHIQHGATLTFREGPPQPSFMGPVEGHTLSIVPRSELPRTLREVQFCFEVVCRPFHEAHDPGNDQLPPFVYRVNKGGPGLDVAGDSLLVDADHRVIRARVTAPAGTTLHYLCAIHSWMQGRIVVE